MAIAPDDPWKKLRDVTVQPQPAAQPAGGGGGGGGLLASLFGGGDSGGGGGGGFLGGDEDGSFRDMLGTLGPIMMMLDPMSQQAGSAMLQLQQGRRELREKKRGRNETMAFLQGEGVGAGEAKYLASNPTALNAWYTQWKTAGTPDWQIHELNDSKGRKQKFMVDMKTGNMQPLGGPGQPKITMQTIYKNGREQKILFNEDTNEIVTELGGQKSELLTPEEVQQKIDIAKAGKTDIEIGNVGSQEKEESKAVGGEKGFGGLYNDIQKSGRNAPSALGTLKIMENAVKEKGFTSGGGGEFILKAKQWARTFGWDPEGVESMEVFTAMNKQAALDAMGGSLGTGFSNADRDFVIEQVPNLSFTKGGNLALIKIQEKIQRQNMKAAKMARDYRKEHGHIDEGFEDELAVWAEENPAFTDADLKEIEALRATPDDVTTPPPPAGGGGEPGENWVDTGIIGSDGKPIRVRRGSVPPPVVTPVTPEPVLPQPQTQPRVTTQPQPQVQQQPNQPRVRSVLPVLPEPNPLRFR